MREPDSAAGNTATVSRLRTCALTGVVSAFLVLAASILLRLGSEFSAASGTYTTLAPAAEGAARLTHRLAATTAGIMAFAVLVFSWRLGLGRMPAAAAVATTILLASIGSLTPGYRIPIVTVMNVSFGMVLMLSFWWLCKVPDTHVPAQSRPTPGPTYRGALLLFVLTVALGAAASAGEMAGIRSWAYLHFALAFATFLLAGAGMVSDFASCREGWATWMLATCLLATVLTGFVMLTMPPRQFGVSYVHGLLMALCGLALVSAARR